LPIAKAEDPSLFVIGDGSKIITLIDLLNAAWQLAGLVRSSFGENYAVYSLRHFTQSMRDAIASACLR
jgi:hypothetical protein